MTVWGVAVRHPNGAVRSRRSRHTGLLVGESEVAPGLHGVKGPLRASAALRVLARPDGRPLTPLRPDAPARTDSDTEVSLPPGQRHGRALRRDDMSDQVEQLQAEIERGVTELVEGEDWRRWLEIAARFPRYRTATLC